jgi:hypothetical protein
LILLIAVVRLLALVFAVYFWWVYTHPEGSKPGAALGAGAITALIIGGAISPLLRDFAFGIGMMAERWFGVGDLISIDFPNVQGVVERITLRSTRLRGLNGEVIWVANQTMSGVRVAQKGVWTTAVELFVTEPESAARLIDRTNNLLPGGLALLVSPLKIVDIVEREPDVWHITAIGETAPGREWILEKTAIEILKKLDADSKKPILIVDPLPRFADKETERQFARAVKNARKTRRTFNYRKVMEARKSQTEKSTTAENAKPAKNPKKT